MQMDFIILFFMCMCGLISCHFIIRPRGSAWRGVLGTWRNVPRRYNILLSRNLPSFPSVCCTIFIGEGVEWYWGVLTSFPDDMPFRVSIIGHDLFDGGCFGFSGLFHV